MSRIAPFLLALTLLPGLCLAAAPPVPIPPGPIASALALVERNKVPEAAAALDALRPEFGDLGPYHYARGRAAAASGKPVEAALHFRFASTYATAPALQETALLLAAETEFGAGDRFEAKTYCLIFLKRFPQSPHAGKVRILLGRSLSAIGRHREAVRLFEQAGASAEALFGKANALQRAGMTLEAARAYADAMAVDETFPRADEETRCWMGENLRVSGHASRAKELLLSVSAPVVKDYATFGLAEIAAEESKADDAVRLFTSLSASKDRKLARNAILRAADVEAATGKASGAVTRLEGIVWDYPFTAEGDQATLRLARMRVAAGDPKGALALLSKLVLRPSAVRGNALDEIEKVLLAARDQGPERLASLWNAGGRWMMDPSREPTLVLIAQELRGTGKPYYELARWLSRYGSAPVRSRHLTLLASQYARDGDIAGLRDCLQGFRALNASGDDVTRAEAYVKFTERDYGGAAKALMAIARPEEGDVSLLADVLPHAEDPAKAAAALEAAVSRTGGGAGVFARLADVHFDAGRRAEAARFYRMAAEKDPDHEWSCYRLVVLLGKDGGEEYRNRIRKDPTLVRMANAAWKEQTLDAR